MRLFSTVFLGVSAPVVFGMDTTDIPPGGLFNSEDTPMVEASQLTYTQVPDNVGVPFPAAIGEGTITRGMSLPVSPAAAPGHRVPYGMNSRFFPQVCRKRLPKVCPTRLCKKRADPQYYRQFYARSSGTPDDRELTDEVHWKEFLLWAQHPGNLSPGSTLPLRTDSSNVPYPYDFDQFVPAAGTEEKKCESIRLVPDVLKKDYVHWLIYRANVVVTKEVAVYASFINPTTLVNLITLKAPKIIGAANPAIDSELVNVKVPVLWKTPEGDSTLLHKKAGVATQGSENLALPTTQDDSATSKDGDDQCSKVPPGFLADKLRNRANHRRQVEEVWKLFDHPDEDFSLKAKYIASYVLDYARVHGMIPVDIWALPSEWARIYDWTGYRYSYGRLHVNLPKVGVGKEHPATEIAMFDLMMLSKNTISELGTENNPIVTFDSNAPKVREEVRLAFFQEAYQNAHKNLEMYDRIIAGGAQANAMKEQRAREERAACEIAQGGLSSASPASSSLLSTAEIAKTTMTSVPGDKKTDLPVQLTKAQMKDYALERGVYVLGMANLEVRKSQGEKDRACKNDLLQLGRDMQDLDLQIFKKLVEYMHGRGFLERVQQRYPKTLGRIITFFSEKGGRLAAMAINLVFIAGVSAYGSVQVEKALGWLVESILRAIIRDPETSVWLSLHYNSRAVPVPVIPQLMVTIVYDLVPNSFKQMAIENFGQRVRFAYTDLVTNFIYGAAFIPLLFSVCSILEVSKVAFLRGQVTQAQYVKEIYSSMHERSAVGDWERVFIPGNHPNVGRVITDMAFMERINEKLGEKPYQQPTREEDVKKMNGLLKKVTGWENKYFNSLDLGMFILDNEPAGTPVRRHNIAHGVTDDASHKVIDGLDKKMARDVTYGMTNFAYRTCESIMAKTGADEILGSAKHMVKTNRNNAISRRRSSIQATTENSPRSATKHSFVKTTSGSGERLGEVMSRTASSAVSSSRAFSRRLTKQFTKDSNEVDESNTLRSSDSIPSPSRATKDNYDISTVNGFSIAGWLGEVVEVPRGDLVEPNDHHLFFPDVFPRKTYLILWTNKEGNQSVYLEYTAEEVAEKLKGSWVVIDKIRVCEG